MGETVVVVGAEGLAARLVLERFGRDERVERVIAIGTPDRQLAGAADAHSAPVTWVDPSDWSSDLKRVFEGATSVIHLGAPQSAASEAPMALEGTGNLADARWARRVLDAASAASVRQLVVLSSAMVYGAWANNPVPLTEEAPLRPDPGVAYAVALGEIERLVVDWRDANPAARVAVLRPTVTVPAAPSSSRWLNQSPWVPLRWRAGDGGPPVQFLLVDDLASAIVHAHRHQLDGPFNVAPEGWIPPEVLPELAGPLPQVQVTSTVADALTAARLRRTGFPPGVAAYLHQSWVVASDRLRGSGWQPADSNEEAFVGAYAAGPLASLDARRRQMLSLGAVGLAVAGAAAVIAVLVRRRGRPT